MIHPNKLIKMKFIKNLIILLFLIPITLSSQNDGTKKVLLVGNSFTYFWNMPQMVNAMAELDDYPMEVRQSTVGGSTWEEHYNEKKGTITRKLLKSKKWDYVVLQDQSSSTIDNVDRFKEYGTKLGEVISDYGAKPYLMMTWAYLSNPLMQDVISDQYRNLAKSMGTDVIPVGEVLMRARELRPDLNFYSDDKHPSPEGSYLVALVMYKALTGNSVNDIPDRLYSEDQDGEKIILSFINPQTGVFLRQLVDQAEFKTKLITL